MHDPQAIENIIKNLNPPQRQAVLHETGPLLILAGAGSGKTRVLTHRVANLIAKDLASPENILAMTFTNKAAREMESRIFQLLAQMGVGLREPLWISTFHSFCSRILRKHIEFLDYQTHFSIYDDSDQLSQIKKIQIALNINEKIYSAKSFVSKINNAKMLGLTPAALQNKNTLRLDDISLSVYSQYELEMKKANALDFGDLLLKTFELFIRKIKKKKQ